MAAYALSRILFVVWSHIFYIVSHSFICVGWLASRFCPHVVHSVIYQSYRFRVLSLICLLSRFRLSYGIYDVLYLASLLFPVGVAQPICCYGVSHVCFVCHIASDCVCYVAYFVLILYGSSLLFFFVCVMTPIVFALYAVSVLLVGEIVLHPVLYCFAHPTLLCIL